MGAISKLSVCCAVVTLSGVGAAFKASCDVERVKKHQQVMKKG